MDLGKQLKIEWKKVLLVWNWSYKNMWDELILLWTIKLLLEQEKEIYVSAYNISWLKSFLAQFIDIEQINFLREIPKWFRSFFRFIRDKSSRTLKKYKEIDSIIIWWGEILTEETPNSYWYRLVSIRPCLRKKEKPNIYLMWGIQVPEKKSNKRLFRYLMNKVDYVYARDLESVYELKKYWFENAEFFMDTSYFAYDWKSVNEKNVRQKYIVVDVNKSGENFLEDIIHDVQYYVNEWYKVLYIPASKARTDQYSDIYYYKKIKSACKRDDKFELLDREENFWKFAEKLANAEVVISTRLHLFLISSFLGVRTKIYPYQKKILKMQEVLRNIEWAMRSE